MVHWNVMSLDNNPVLFSGVGDGSRTKTQYSGFA